MSPKGHTLSVLSTLVYGTPPQIRIDGGEMVHLAGDVPKRDIPAEKRIVKRLRDELNMIPGRSVHYDGLEAGRFAKRLQEFQTGVRGGQESSFSSNILVDKPLHAEITVEGDSFNLTFRTQDDEER